MRSYIPHHCANKEDWRYVSLLTISATVVLEEVVSLLIKLQASVCVITINVVVVMLSWCEYYMTSSILMLSWCEWLHDCIFSDFVVVWLTASVPMLSWCEWPHDCICSDVVVVWVTAWLHLFWCCRGVSDYMTASFLMLSWCEWLYDCIFSDVVVVWITSKRIQYIGSQCTYTIVFLLQCLQRNLPK